MLFLMKMTMTVGSLILLLKYKHTKSRPISWIEKADNILASTGNCQLISKADMEDSYYRKAIVLCI